MSEFQHPPPVLLTANGTQLPFPPANGRNFTLDELQLAVKGYIQVVDLRGTDLLLIINEEGKIHELPPNGPATREARRTGSIFHDDHIAGDALVCPASMVE